LARRLLPGLRGRGAARTVPLIRGALPFVIVVGCAGRSIMSVDGSVAADAPVDALTDAAEQDGGSAELGPCDAVHPCGSGTDCIPVAWLGGARRCLVRCAATASCETGQVCYHQ